jgi:hypothetical protein
MGFKAVAKLLVTIRNISSLSMRPAPARRLVWRGSALLVCVTVWAMLLLRLHPTSSAARSYRLLVSHADAGEAPPAVPHSPPPPR